MSKQRKHQRQGATSAKQIKAQESIHHQRMVAVTLQHMGGRTETRVMSEWKLMQLQKEGKVQYGKDTVQSVP